MARFAEGTEVAVSKTRDELERLLAKHGAAQRMIVVDDVEGHVMVRDRRRKYQWGVRFDTGERAWLPATKLEVVK